MLACHGRNQETIVLYPGGGSVFLDSSSLPNESQSSKFYSKAERGARSVFIDTKCLRLTDKPLRMIKQLSVQILWNVAFQTLKGRRDRHGNGTWGLEMGDPLGSSKANRILSICNLKKNKKKTP